MSDLPPPTVPPLSSPAVPVPSGKPPVPVWLIAGGGAAVVLGGFLPWLSVNAALLGSISRNGLDTSDGKLTVAGGLALAVAGGMALAGRRLAKLWLLAVIVGALVALVAAYDFSDISGRAKEIESSGAAVASVGIGLWLTIAGAVAAGVGGLLAHQSPATAAPQA